MGNVSHKNLQSSDPKKLSAALKALYQRIPSKSEQEWPALLVLLANHTLPNICKLNLTAIEPAATAGGRKGIFGKKSEDSPQQLLAKLCELMRMFEQIPPELSGRANFQENLQRIFFPLLLKQVLQPEQSLEVQRRNDQVVGVSLSGAVAGMPSPTRAGMKGLYTHLSKYLTDLVTDRAAWRGRGRERSQGGEGVSSVQLFAQAFGATRNAMQVALAASGQGQVAAQPQDILPAPEGVEEPSQPSQGRCSRPPRDSQGPPPGNNGVFDLNISLQLMDFILVQLLSVEYRNKCSEVLVAELETHCGSGRILCLDPASAHLAIQSVEELIQSTLRGAEQEETCMAALRCFRALLPRCDSVSPMLHLLNQTFACHTDCWEEKILVTQCLQTYLQQHDPSAILPVLFPVLFKMVGSLQGTIQGSDQEGPVQLGAVCLECLATVIDASVERNQPTSELVRMVAVIFMLCRSELRAQAYMCLTALFRSPWFHGKFMGSGSSTEGEATGVDLSQHKGIWGCFWLHCTSSGLLGVGDLSVSQLEVDNSVREPEQERMGNFVDRSAQCCLAMASTKNRSTSNLECCIDGLIGTLHNHSADTQLPPSEGPAGGSYSPNDVTAADFPRLPPSVCTKLGFAALRSAFISQGAHSLPEGIVQAGQLRVEDLQKALSKVQAEREELMKQADKTAKEMESLQNVKNLMQCAICLETLTENEPCTLRCGHLFHTPCITAVMRSQAKRCPLCREEIKDQPIRLRGMEV